MKLTLRQIRKLIREQLSLLSELRLFADESGGAETYRAIELINGSTSESVGKFIMIPIDMPKYGKDGLDGWLKAKGLQPIDPETRQAPKGATYHYAQPGRSLVVDHSRKVIDVDVSEYAQYLSRRPGPGQSSKSYIIPHNDMAFGNVVKLKKMLQSLMSVDPRIQPDYKVVGNPALESMTVAAVIKDTKDVAQQAVKGGQAEPMTFYHGTSEKRLAVIKSQGLRPGKTPEAYGDLVPDYSEHNVYLTSTVPTAENYASRASIDDHAKAVVLKVIVRDPTKLVLDEDTANWLTVTDPQGNERDVHFRDIYANWRSWANADKIMQQYQAKLAKEINRAGTVAYKGRIPASDISVYSIYKPASMKKDPDWQEFSDAKKKTMDTYKTGEELPKKHK